jgi:hypothetical protein
MNSSTPHLSKLEGGLESESAEVVEWPNPIRELSAEHTLKTLIIILPAAPMWSAQRGSCAEPNRLAKRERDWR